MSIASSLQPRDPARMKKRAATDAYGAGGMHRVFTYETLRNIATMSHIIGYDPNWRPVEALDQEKVTVMRDPDGGDPYDTIRPNRGERVKGALVLVDDDGLRKLDNWEQKYVRRLIQLTDGRPAWAYVMKEHLHARHSIR